MFESEGTVKKGRDIRRGKATWASISYQLTTVFTYYRFRKITFNYVLYYVIKIS